jgi:hypothetical protein
MDDATSWIYSASFIDREVTMSSTIEAHGLFGSLYTDRGSHHPGRGWPGRQEDPDPGRPRLEAVGHPPHPILHARGSGSDGTGVPDVATAAGAYTASGGSADDANAHLRDTYVPEHNKQFGKDAAEPGSAFGTRAGIALDEVPSV